MTVIGGARQAANRVPTSSLGGTLTHVAHSGGPPNDQFESFRRAASPISASFLAWRAVQITRSRRDETG
jgi:hypothetical protein